MKNVLNTPKVYMLAGLLAIAVTAIAWQTKTKKQPHDTTATGNAANGDTTRPRKHVTDQDDFGLNGLDESLRNIDINLKNIDFNFKDLDTTIEKSVREALANIDFKEIGRQTSEALDKIDWKEMQNTINKSITEATSEIKKIDWDKINAEIKEATDKVNSKEFKEEFNGKNLQQIIDNAMEKATEGLDNAKAELKMWKGFTNDLEKDGLIDKKKGYKIEWKDDGSLFINGKKQSKEVTDKYNKYYKEGGYTLSNDGDEAESL